MPDRAPARRELATAVLRVARIPGQTLAHIESFTKEIQSLF